MKGSGRQVKRVLVLVMSALLVVVGQIIPVNSPEYPLRVAVGLWPGSESLLEAQERGLLPESDFVFLEATWPSAAYRAFDNEAVDAAVLSTEDVDRLRASGEDVRIICFMDESEGADALISVDGVRSIRELAGKRIGVASHGPGHHFLEDALASGGLKGDDVEIVTLLEPDIPDSLGSGLVSAVVAAEPWIEGILSGGGRILMDSGRVKASYYRLLVAREAALREKRTAFVQLLRAHFATAPLLGALGEGGSKGKIPKRQRVSPESFTDIMSRIRIFTPEENLKLMESDGISVVGSDESGMLKKWADDRVVREVMR